MAATTRTDVHRPSSPDFDPQAYTLLGVFDLDPEWPTGERQFRADLISQWLARGYSFARAPHPTGQCDHCGARIRYEALTAHAPTRTLIEFGETCLDNRLGETAASFQALRKRAARTAKETREAHARGELHQAGLEWLTDADPELRELLDTSEGSLTTGNGFLSDLATKLFRYGYLTDRQAEAAVTAIRRDRERRERIARREAEDAQRRKTASPAPTGRVPVEGIIGATWMRDSDYGTQYKFRVLTDAGWAVISTIPQAIIDQLQAEVGPQINVWAVTDRLRERRVRFTITLKPMDDDPTAAWGSRPTKAELV